MLFEPMERPERNRRHLSDEDMLEDMDLELAMLTTLNGCAIKIPLWRFHSSPAKGSLWKQGYKVKHRVLPDLQTVAAWVE